MKYFRKSLFEHEPKTKVERYDDDRLHYCYNKTIQVIVMFKN